MTTRRDRTMFLVHPEGHDARRAELHARRQVPHFSGSVARHAVGPSAEALVASLRTVAGRAAAGDLLYIAVELGGGSAPVHVREAADLLHAVASRGCEVVAAAVRETPSRVRASVRLHGRTLG